MKNKKSLSALISLAAIVLVVGTLAYFSRDLTVENRLKTAKYVLKLIKKLQLKILETLILW